MEKKWYVIHTYPGHEKKVKKLLEQAAIGDVAEKLGRILIPTEDVSRIKGGKRTTVEKQIYPGYVLVEMELDDDTLQLVTSTPGITSFLGTRARLHPIQEKEVHRVLSYVETERAKPSSEVSFKVGESVKVTHGPFTDFTGVVDEIYPEREKLRVMVTIFGRTTPIELDFLQVQPI
ncbi:hypothetical protein AMJ39_00530 [candidate division TA06 bacterium DG_24]|jgi:transcriptional antiterminator NusG|uniref:Transcription termination/antitermination protein NusG n=3 Tax=Bacteria division TA06 TaxID=1156500 RepID=A0A0S8JF72_UNCT6|nr:MAG: hypothetical protein AMJ39_00530 [candidate division TA06 bacterium DG_24]KPK68740.1 MAG: hypothetical protein AMJ82_07475 [candidate division TA06 bacterium SM23_40]KPL08369.1 MAG: hypothetical protein AMJ71_08410 [candidate division TA06 bacterium SM1_40]